MNNAKKAVKMALKRAQVDAVLRCAGLSQWFTQDLEEPASVAPQAQQAPSGNGKTPARIGADVDTKATPPQVKVIRILLKMAGKGEREILAYYGVDTLEELHTATARKLQLRLQEMRRSR